MKDNIIDFQGNEDELEFMPILPLNEDFPEDTSEDEIPEIIPLLPLRNTVLFPGVILPITVGRDKSIDAVESANSTEKKILGVVAQKDSEVEEPEIKDLASVGTVARIVKVIKMPDGGTTVIIQGRSRFEVTDVLSDDPHFLAQVKLLEEEQPETDDKKEEFDAYSSSIKELASKIIKLSPNIPNEADAILKNIDDKAFLIHFVASNLSSELKEKQQLLEMNNLSERAEFLLKLLQTEEQLAELKNKITTRTRSDLDKQQREYFLQQQIKSIKEELGGESDREIRELEKRAEKKKWTQAAQEAFDKNIKRLERTHPSAPDYSVIYNNLELMLDLPWEEYTEDKYDLKRARKILDRNHYDMDKIKDRIIEYLAVLKLKGDMKSPILCFVGPPGIGKTSLGKSIAAAINRKYARLSLGGLHDESEIRGHRKTYIGAMPGRIIQNLRKLKASNPVMVLDEVDKVGGDFHGDPSSALLEVLDPEQNSTFYDNYLELEYDLSKVLFIATANSLNGIHPALRDRLEIIPLSGYAVEEKIEIAKRHLLPKQKKAHGLTGLKMTFPKKILEKVIQDYTRESGVRELDRQLASILRSVAKKVALEEEVPVRLTKELLLDMLGKPRFSQDVYKAIHHSGVVVGLAWTSVGGDILFIEVSLSEGKGELKLTGNLGNVMKESASTALSYLKAHAKDFDIDPELFGKKNIHIHVPEGAVPKDGPSAGITMLTALTSAFKEQSIKPYLAMTGEITLRGEVLPVGGIKEKVLAAKRAGLKEIIMCKKNEQDIEEINKDFIKGMKFHYVEQMDEVIHIALKKKKI
ncbi:MAG TPA: endopeptidase La [Chitinophagaceae bacterium]|nr:endopeptidase La [Chitinophagaceae bacterium]